MTSMLYRLSLLVFRSLTLGTECPACMINLNQIAILIRPRASRKAGSTAQVA